MIMDKYNTMLFSDVWDDSEDFKAEYKASALYDYEPAVGTTPAKYHNSLSDKNIDVLFALLYARYGTSPIANTNVDQWKYKVWTIIFEHGPIWQKELEIQDKLRDLTEEEVLKGAKAIYNHAYNDGTAPSTGTLEEIEYLNEQNTAINKKSKMAGYAELLAVIRSNNTSLFLDKFRRLFSVVVAPQFGPRIFSEEEEEDI